MNKQDKIIAGIVVIWFVLLVIGLSIARPQSGQTRHEEASPDPIECQNLKAWFDYYNTAYFMGVLPKDVVIEYGPVTRGAMAETKKVGSKFHIILVRKYNLPPRISHEVLLHESCHVLTWAEPLEHGPMFKDCMHRLYEQGAFEGLL